MASRSKLAAAAAAAARQTDVRRNDARRRNVSQSAPDDVFDSTIDDSATQRHGNALHAPVS